MTNADPVVRVVTHLRGILPLRFRADIPVVPVVRLTGVIGFSTPLKPGLMVNDAAGQPTPAAEQILRHAAPLSLGVSKRVS